MAETEKMQHKNRRYSISDKQGGASLAENKAMNSSADSVSGLVDEFRCLMEGFVNEVKLSVPCSGIRFKAGSVKQAFLSGVLEQYLCCYEIKVAENTFGYVYFARETKFIDSELQQLENQVAGLALPLYHLFLAQGVSNNS